MLDIHVELVLLRSLNNKCDHIFRFHRRESMDLIINLKLINTVLKLVLIINILRCSCSSKLS